MNKQQYTLVALSQAVYLQQRYNFLFLISLFTIS